jgi:alpha-D-ribose 1-methylphosphonate 5-triphosphate synthase subunit PhnH
MSNGLTAGFADPVTDAQACFRSVLDAMARPGQVHAVHGLFAPPPLCNAAAAVLLTLADHETPLWLDPRAEPAAAWLAFHTGASVGPAARAVLAFALLLPDLALPDLAGFPTGTDEMPETSATVILQVASLTTGRRFILEGPGLREPAVLHADGLPADFAAIWQRNHALFPRGIDLVLCAGDRLAALPRSVNLKEA